MGHIPNTPEEFERRTLTAKRGADRVEMLVYIDGQQFAFNQSRKAMAMLFVSRPDSDGFDLEIVEKGAAPYTEFTHPGDESATLHQWQSEACAIAHDGGMFRRSYPVEGEALDEATRIEIRIRVDGVTFLAMSAREPGVMGFVRTPDGFDVHVVGAKAAHHGRDRSGPGEETYPPYPWQLAAIGI